MPAPYGYRWERARADFLASNPLCVYCQKRGRMTLAEVVDHIVPHKGDLELFWKEDNWQALCTECHNGDKKRIEHGGKPKGCGVDGWPIDHGS